MDTIKEVQGFLYFYKFSSSSSVPNSISTLIYLISYFYFKYQKRTRVYLERIQKKLGIPIIEMTFHKLGLEIITSLVKSRPEISDNELIATIKIATHLIE